MELMTKQTLCRWLISVPVFAVLILGLSACGNFTAPFSRDEPLPNAYFIFFENGSHELSEESRRIVGEVAGHMQTYAELSLNIVGHRSSSEAEGIDQRRALAAAEAIARSGISPPRINIGGRGNRESVASAARSDGSVDQRVDMMFTLSGRQN
jgi:outer membrane protein OmpA-like peptidoglycan-associated protein